jgi:hypothetical protein
MDIKKMAGKDEFGTPCAFYIGGGVTVPSVQMFLDGVIGIHRLFAQKP